MKAVEIPGGLAHLREAEEIRTRHKQLVELAAIAASSALDKIKAVQVAKGLDEETVATAGVAAFGLTLEEAQAIYHLRDATVIAALASWTRPEPLPTMDTIGDTLPEVSEALYKATARLIGPIISGTNFEPTDPKAPGFEDSPTEPSADLGNGSRASSASESIGTSLMPGTSISSDAPSPD